MAQAEQTTIEFSQKAGPDVRLTGKLLVYVDARKDGVKANPERQRWTELHLYELANGDWAAVTLGLSDKEGEADMGSYKRIARRDPPNQHLMWDEVMAFFEYSPLAWALAKKMEWVLVEEVQ